MLYALNLSDAYCKAVRIRWINMVEAVQAAPWYNRVGLARIY